MKFLQSTSIESEWGAFLWRDVEKTDLPQVSAEVADEQINALGARSEQVLTREEKRAQRQFERSVEKLEKKLDSGNVDTGELEEIATVMNAGAATPEQKESAGRALQQIPMEDLLKSGKSESRAETLRQIFIVDGQIDLHGVTINDSQKPELEKILGAKFLMVKNKEKKNEQVAKTYDSFATEFEGWIQNGLKVAEIIAMPNWTNIPASVIRKQTPETLQKLFIENGAVNFHGNNNAARYIGAGDLFEPEQEWIEIDGKLGRRSIDDKFNSKKVGYVDELGRYLKITNRGETIRVVPEPEEAQRNNFAESRIDPTYEQENAAGGILRGEDAYRESFWKPVEQREKRFPMQSRKDWARNIENNQDLLEHGRIDLDRVQNGREQLNSTIEQILLHRADYLAVEAATGVPWKLVAAIHYRESANNFDTYLHNGQPLGQETTIQPKGIFFEKGQWRAAAIDAMLRIKNSNYDLSKISSDASFSEMLAFAERYNGMGYDNKNLESPYVWSGTTNYEKGKYVADGEFDPEAVDQQLGVAPIVAALDVAANGYEYLDADQLTFPEAREILTPDRFALASTSGKFEDRTDRTQTTLEGLRTKTARGALNLLDKIGVAHVTITGGTETGHEGGLSGRPGTHGGGAKLDFDNDAATSRALEQYFAQNSVTPHYTSDGAMYRFEADGYAYRVLREDDHWDVEVA